MHVLDTDTLTHLHAGHPRVIKRLQEVDDPDICTTIITKIELLRGRFEFLLINSSLIPILRNDSFNQTHFAMPYALCSMRLFIF